MCVDSESLLILEWSEISEIAGENGIWNFGVHGGEAAFSDSGSTMECDDKCDSGEDGNEEKEAVV